MEALKHRISIIFSVTVGDPSPTVALTTDVYNATTSSIYDTYDYFIHPHWKQFGLVPDHWHYIVGIYITIVGIIGIIGNSVVIWTFSTYVFIFFLIIIILPSQIARRGVMVFNATFNNISIISWRSVLLVEETGVAGKNHRPAANH